MRKNTSNVYFRAQALISRAYGLPEAERDAYIENACEQNPDLRQEVGWFLDVLQGPDDDFLSDSAATHDSSELHAPTPRNYTLIRKLGEGGMGVVYQAERSEGEFRHTVALKMLNILALQDQGILARFLSERKILARLNHPNISHLVDAGALADGRPFLAMEYIEGLRIDHYCSARGVSLRERLQLFVKVCAAVQYAHQQLIIHRDIKPANILVTEEGEPKLLDFGIARLMDSSEAMTHTAGGISAMTLAYASPEQVEGRPLSTATDEYSLGVTLYELLTGAHPWGSLENPAEIIHAVSASQPAAPSVVLRARRADNDRAFNVRHRFWQRRDGLPRDIDAIVLKAMRREPQERYASVGALADDINRFLRGQPVHARQMHPLYWLRKFAARHKIGVAVAILGVALIIAFLFDRQMQLEQTRAQRARAEAVAELLTSMFKSADPTEAAHPNMSAREALDQAASRLGTDLANQPQTQATLWLALGNAYDGLSLVKQAGPAFEKALELVSMHPDFDVRLRVDVLSRAAEFGAESLGDSHRADSLGRQAVDLARRHLAPGEPARVAALQRLSAVLSNAKPGQTNESAALAMQAVDEARLSLIDLERTQATQRNLAQVLINSGKLEQADALFRKMLPELERRLGLENIIVLSVRNDHARVLLSQGKYDQAEPMIRESLARAERRFGIDSLQPAIHLNSLADLYNRMDRQDDAVDAMTRALDLTNRHDSRDVVHRGQLTCNLAYALALVNRLEEADRQGKECVRLRFLPDADLSGYFKGHAWYVVGTIKNAQGDVPGAMTAFEKGVDYVREDANRNGLNLYLALDKTIANLALVMHDIAKAEKYTNDFGQHMTFSDDPGMIGMHHAVLRAKIAIERGDAEALAKREREAWDSLKHATGNCESQTVALRDFIRLNTPAGETPGVDLSETPVCAAGATK